MTRTDGSIGVYSANTTGVVSELTSSGPVTVAPTSTFRATLGLAAAVNGGRTGGADGSVSSQPPAPVFSRSPRWVGRHRATWTSAGLTGPVASTGSSRATSLSTAASDLQGRIHVFTINQSEHVFQTWQKSIRSFDSWGPLGWWPVSTAST